MCHTFHTLKHTGICTKHIQINTHNIHRQTYEHMGTSTDVKTCTNTAILTRACTQIRVHASIHTGGCPPGLARCGAVGEGPCVRVPQLLADLGGVCFPTSPLGCVRAYLPRAGLGGASLVAWGGAEGGMQALAHGGLRVPQTSCLALEPHLGLALVELPGKAQEAASLHSYQ